MTSGIWSLALVVKQNACSQPGPREGGDTRSERTGAELEEGEAGTHDVVGELWKTQFSPQFRAGNPGMVPKTQGEQAPGVIPVSTGRTLLGTEVNGPRSKQIPTSRAARSRVSPPSL